jgi:integrase
MPTFTTKKPGKGKAADGMLYLGHIEPPASGQRFVFDDHRDAPRGFGFRVTQAGGRAFILQYTVEGRQRRKTIGDYPTWTLEAARTEARELVQRISKGDDPLEAKRRRRAEPLMQDVARDWMEKHASGLRSFATIRGLVENDIIPAIGEIKITDVRRRDVIELVEAKAEKAPRSAAQLLIYARKILTFAADREYIAANPAADLKPDSITVTGKKKPLAPTVRKRVLDADEIRRFWHKVEDADIFKLTALALKLVLVTGQRPGEVAGMHQDEIDGRWWTIPASRRGKTDTTQRVYLTDTALQIIGEARAEIDRLTRRRREPWAGHIFEARPNQPITNAALTRAATRRRDFLGNKDAPIWGHWTPHDLRRSMRTGLSACRVRPDIAEIAIGHVIGGIRGTYDQHDYSDEIRAALEAWDRRLTAIIEGRDPDSASGDNVVQMVERA